MTHVIVAKNGHNRLSNCVGLGRILWLALFDSEELPPLSYRVNILLSSMRHYLRVESWLLGVRSYFANPECRA